MGRVKGAVLAQAMAQALTAWTLLIHLMRWPDVSPIALASLLGAAVVPFRHDGSPKDRAAGVFGAGLLVTACLFWEIIFGGLGWLSGGEARLGVEVLLMLVASVLFSLAGGMYWTLREDEDA